jgi:hypothetical protein
MDRAWLVLLFCGLVGLIIPATALGDTVTEGPMTGQVVYVMNGGLPWWVTMAFLGVIIVLLGLLASQLSGIKAAIEKSAGTKAE